jgi:hypothetical protein
MHIFRPPLLLLPLLLGPHQRSQIVDLLLMLGSPRALCHGVWRSLQLLLLLLCPRPCSHDIQIRGPWHHQR